MYSNSDSRSIFTRSSLLLLLLIVLFHYPVSTGYVWDDTLLIELNPWKDSFNNLGFVWTNSLWSGIPGEHVNHWYRPLMGSHILLDQWVFGDALRPKQWVNVAWFAAMSILLNRWLNSTLSLSKEQSLLIVGLLVVHPYSVELTHFIAARNDTMTLTFALCIPLLITQPPNIVHHVWVTLLVFGTMCSKESGLMWICLLTAPKYSKIPNYWVSFICGFAMWLIMKSNANLEPISLSKDWLAILQTWTHTGTWAATISSPLQPIPENISYAGLVVIGLMTLFTRDRVSSTGLVIFLGGGLLAAIASEQSATLGFRYLWIPLLGQTVWLVSKLPSQRTTLLLLPFILLGIQTLKERDHWIDNTTFWENGYTNHPNQHTACGSFMTLRDNPSVALIRLEDSIAHPPKLHCCAQASRYPLELDEMALTVSMGNKAIENGCPNIPELLAPIAMASAVLGNWTQSMKILEQYSTDPFGYKPLLETAYGLQQNDTAPLKYWSTPENPMLPNTSVVDRERMLKAQAESLLEKIQSYSDRE